MSKSVKAIVIVAAVMLGLGGAAIVAGLLMGGSVMQMGWNTGNGFGTSTSYGNQNVQESYGNQDIEELEVSVGACSLIIEEGDDFNLSVTGNGPKVESTMENGVWKVTNAVNGINFGLKNVTKDYKITMTLPKGYQVKKATLEIGAGQMEIDSLAAREVDIEVGAGQVVIKNLQAEETTMNCGAGQILVDRAVLTGQIDLDCAMGQINMRLVGNEDDYGFNFDVGMGEIKIGGNSAAGLGGGSSKTVAGDNFIDAQCGMGQITVDFVQ